ncbi:MAG: prolyl oligopeptidase family serine peptidase [Anaerolineales bacterium]|nr:prolyl oligopeptidase family serine peptidase [Anaerolineales bacterium]
MKGIDYPNSKKTDQTDDYHGTIVADPYRWLEDVDSTETLEWIKKQNEVTFSFLEQIPSRDVIRNRLTELWDFPKAYAPQKHGQRYFQMRNSGLQNQDVLHIADRFDGPWHVLLDPNTLSDDGTVALTSWNASKDGSKIAYATSISGSDWLTWRVRDVSTGKDLPDVIEWSKFSEAAWLTDGSGFFYAKYDEPEQNEAYDGLNLNQKLFLHILGISQSEDELILHRPDQPEWGFSPRISDDGFFLILHVWQGTDARNRLFYKTLNQDDVFIELINDLEANYEFVGNDGPVIYLRTDYEAPRGKLIAIDTRKPQKENWVTIIPESKDVLETVKMGKNQFVVIYLHNAHHRIRLFDITGNPSGEIDLPTLGSIVAFNQNTDLHSNRSDDELFFSFHSFAVPPTGFRFDFYKKSSHIIEDPKINFDFDTLTTEQVIVKSKDGTQVPLFLVHRNDITLNSINPTLLYGYGGFNIPTTPTFSTSRLIWLELGGVLAVACLRGGSEYGEEWHQAGMLHNKQNVYDDFISCASYLIDNGYTKSPKLAIQGRSNGGLLVGACITQRPDLFGAALPAVGVMDMLRFHKFTIGWAWVSDYGSSEEPDQFETLFKYSPLHNIKPSLNYPATLITTADHDDRVVPGHSFKFAAALQAAQAGDPPILIRIQTKAGHGFGKPTSLLIEEEADIWAFLVEVLDIE